MELGSKFDISREILLLKLKRISGTSDGRRQNVLYKINPKRLRIECGNGCSKSAEYLLYMCTHAGNISNTANCEEHSQWFKNWFDKK